MVVEEFLEENNDRIKISLIHEKFLERHLKSDVYQKSIKEEGAPSEERKKVMELLFDVFQKEIFVWKNFGIKLPHSVIAEQNLFVSNSQLFQDDLHLNELHDVALGPGFFFFFSIIQLLFYFIFFIIFFFFVLFNIKIK